MRACVRSLGHTVDDLDIVEAYDMIVVNLRSFSPRICNLRDFYAGLFPKKDSVPKLESSMTYNPQSREPFGTLRSAEQLESFLNFFDKRKMKNDK